MSTESITVRGARVHNLKNIDFEIPHNTLTVVTGVSGSGKSSLAFDTIYAEGQRRYVESLSAYARQFLERIEKPDVDIIDGIAPAVAIRQKNQTRNPRSTVATATEIYDYLRLLFARVGRTFCANCGTEVRKDTVDEVADKIMALGEGTRLNVLFPVQPPPPPLEPEKKPRGRKKAAPKFDITEGLKARLGELRKRGFNRLFQNGNIVEFSSPESLLELDFSKPVFVLLDRIALEPESRPRVVDAIETAYRESGEIVFQTAPRDDSAPQTLRFAQRFECKQCNIRYEEPEPRLFSFNNPYGACPRCQGFGNTIDYDMDLVIPNPGLSLDEGAVDPWTKPQYEWNQAHYKKGMRGKVRWNVPYADLSAEERAIAAKAIQEFFTEVEAKKYKVHVRVFLSRYRGYAECPDCGGARLRRDALNVRIADKTIAGVVKMNIEHAYKFFESLELSPEESAIADKILVEIRQRLKFLNDVGLDYLTLDRLSSTLSGGEAQRIQLATCLGSRLVGACYVLDEPSIGLHARDTGRLIRILEELRDLGNTIVVVEHDADVMRSADHIIDMGPGAGELGGEVVFEGSYRKIISDGAVSLTSRYLRGDLRAAQMSEAREVDPRRTVKFYGARAHNLKGIDVTIPLDMMVAITGVSGSGKSTLVHDVIYRSLSQRLRQADAEGYDENQDQKAEKVTCRRIDRAELVREIVLVDQSPIGRTPRSNPATYIKAYDLIRELFASTPEAGKRGYNAGHFSFNIPGGRCENCQGDGTVTVEMQFLADVELICEECKGTRFKSAILDIPYRGLNIHQVLQLTVKEAMGFFHDSKRLYNKLKVLADVGLGYLRLGQSATTLSGGEAQRVKLASHLAQATCSGTLFIFDEPTTGLHFDDIAKLLAAFQRLIQSGGSVLIIEHNLDVIRNADWVIDLGPEGGERGGQIVAEGTPEQIAAARNSYTGRYLKEYAANAAR
ncbi:MAG: excinuclease ABC subunit UvrA [Terriglobia bacterium]|nr:excinuclease ABC subunit UvrA [Terriglobia bacterium]